MLHLVSSDQSAGGSDHQREIDEMLAAVRAEGGAVRPSLFKPPAPRPAPSTDVLDLRIAEELAAVKRRLDHLGNILAGDPILLHRHAAQLQSIDLIQQVLGHLAQVIATEDRAAAVELISLTELKGRLKRTSLAR